MFELSTVTAFVAGLSVSGVTMLDYGDVKMAFDDRDGPVFYPNVAAPVTVNLLERDSVGAGTEAAMTLVYSVPYRLLYAQFGVERGLSDIWPGMIATLRNIFTALVENDTPVLGGSSVNLEITSVTLGATVADPAAKPFHGADVVIQIMEFIH